MANDPLLAAMLQRAEGVGPAHTAPMEAGVPKGPLWNIMTAARDGMPEFQKLIKYLELTPVGDMAKTGARMSKELANEVTKRVMSKPPKGPTK